MQMSARPRKPQDTSSRFAVPSGAASKAVSVGPASAPQLPPADTNPNRRCACCGRNRSTIRLQKSDTTNRLKTLTQTKKARATAGGATPRADRAEKENTVATKKKKGHGKTA